MVSSLDGPQMIWYTKKNQFFCAARGKQTVLLQPEWLQKSGEYLNIMLSADGCNLALLHQNCIQVVSLDFTEEQYQFNPIDVNLMKANMLW